MPRVENALSQLVISFLPASSDVEDEEATPEQKHDQNLELARSILKNEAVELPDNDHISYLVKKKCRTISDRVPKESAEFL
ncbi:MAG: hypothetical protein Q9187_006917 [Circinaria calcarea]